MSEQTEAIETVSESELDELYDSFYSAIENAPSTEELKKKTQALVKGWSEGVSDETHLGEQYGDLVITNPSLVPAAFEMVQETIPALTKYMGQDWAQKWMGHEMQHFDAARKLGLEAKVVISFGLEGKKISRRGDVSWESAGVQPHVVVKFPDGLSIEQRLELTKQLASAPTDLSEQDVQQVRSGNDFLSLVDSTINKSDQ